jgi:hypothetical protein
MDPPSLYELRRDRLRIDANKKQLWVSIHCLQMLFAVEKQLAPYRQRIEELFARHPIMI